MKRALTIAEACEVYSMSRSQLDDLRANHDFPFVRIGRKVWIPVAAADQWFADRVGQDVAS